MTETIVMKINKLADMHSAKDVLGRSKQTMIDVAEKQRQEKLNAIFTPEINAKLAEIDHEYASELASIGDEFGEAENRLAENISDLEAEIKEDVLVHGATVKGEFMQAVYSKGRVSWDTKALDGFAKAHPEIAEFRKIGNPSISIRFNGGK